MFDSARVQQLVNPAGAEGIRQKACILGVNYLLLRIWASTPRAKIPHDLIVRLRGLISELNGNFRMFDKALKDIQTIIDTNPGLPILQFLAMETPDLDLNAMELFEKLIDRNGLALGDLVKRLCDNCITPDTAKQVRGILSQIADSRWFKRITRNEAITCLGLIPVPPVPPQPLECLPPPRIKLK